jgi:glycosyltransferase involved in cell wall biosynthesis
MHSIPQLDPKPEQSVLDRPKSRFPWEQALRESGIDITLMVPCYNEEENVTAALEDIRNAVTRLKITYEVIVIDDCSKDRTFDKVREYQAQHPAMPIYLHRNEVNHGLAQNFVDGAFMAQGRYYRMVCGDAVESADAIADVLSHMGEADLIIPFVEGQPVGKSLGRRLLSKTFVKIVNLCSGYRIRYYNGLAIYRTFDVLRMHTQSRGFGFQAETITRMLDSGCTYQQIPSTFHERVAGSSKAITVHNWLSTGYAVFRIFMNRLRRQFFK